MLEYGGVYYAGIKYRVNPHQTESNVAYTLLQIWAFVWTLDFWAAFMFIRANRNHEEHGFSCQNNMYVFILRIFICIFPNSLLSEKQKHKLSLEFLSWYSLETPTYMLSSTEKKTHYFHNMFLLPQYLCKIIHFYYSKSLKVQFDSLLL